MMINIYIFSAYEKDATPIALVFINMFDLCMPMVSKLADILTYICYLLNILLKYLLFN